MVKQRGILILYLLLLTPLLTQAVITGEVITGKATTGYTGVGVVVIGKPNIIITYPENKTYITNNLTLTYLYSGSPTNTTYSVDHTLNITLQGNGTTHTLFNEGLQRLDLWANNTYGTGNDNTYLTINTSRLTIIYTEFNGSHRGTSTDFKSVAYEDLQNLTGIILEDIRYAKIIFQEEINVEEDVNTSDRIVNLDINVNLSNSTITLDSTNLPNFNVSAQLSFYGLTYTNPQVLINGVTCPESICSNQTYNSGTLTINVAHFSTFTIQETPEEEPEPEPSSGGGGGGTSTYYSIDIITPGTIEIGKNDQVLIPVTIRNPEKSVMKGIRLSANTSTKELSAVFQDTTISELQSGENKTLMLFLASTGLLPGNYEIEIIAEVNDPEFTEKEKLYVRAVEIVGKVEVLERIILAQELFRENPECLELNDLLLKAQDYVDQGDVNSARTLIQEAISRCRDLVTNKEFPNSLNFGNLSEWRTPIEIALLLIVITLIISLAFRRTHLDLRRHKERKKSFWKRIFRR